LQKKKAAAAEKKKAEKKAAKLEQKRLEKIELKKKEKLEEKRQKKEEEKKQNAPPAEKLQILLAQLKKSLTAGKEQPDKALVILKELDAFDATRDLLEADEYAAVVVIRKVKKYKKNEQVSSQAKNLIAKWKAICM